MVSGIAVAHDGANPPQQLTFGIRETFHHRRAVQIEVNPIQRRLIQRYRKRRADPRGDPLERLVLHRAGGIGETPGQRHQVDPGFLRRRDRPGQRHRPGPHRRNQRPRRP